MFSFDRNILWDLYCYIIREGDVEIKGKLKILIYESYLLQSV
jgi:hypothetical protein